MESRPFGLDRSLPYLTSIAKGLEADKKQREAFKAGDMAQFGVAIAEIIEVDGDQVYAKIGPSEGWYEKKEITDLGLKWKKPEDFNKRCVNVDNTVTAQKKKSSLKRKSQQQMPEAVSPDSQKTQEDRAFHVTPKESCPLCRGALKPIGNFMGKGLFRCENCSTEMTDDAPKPPVTARKVECPECGKEGDMGEGGNFNCPKCGDMTGDEFFHSREHNEASITAQTDPLPMPKIPDDENYKRDVKEIKCVQCMKPFKDDRAACPLCGHEKGRPRKSQQEEEVAVDMTELKFMDRHEKQQRIDEILDAYNRGEISLEKMKALLTEYSTRFGMKKEVTAALKRALKLRGAPKSNVEDEDIWAKAKKAADKTYDRSNEFYYAVVTDIYKNMGGKFKK